MEEQKAPPLEYTPMGDAFAEPPKKETTFTSDIRGIEKAADALEESRAAEKETVERKYIQVGGEHHGEDMPPDRSIDLKRAVADISRQRGFEREAAEHEGAEVLANEVDAYRAAEQAKQQPQQQPQQQQAPEVQAQISPDQVPPGVDIEVVTALQNNPKLRAAVESEVIKADQARQAYAVATQHAAQVAVASILADYPELAGLNASQIPTALQVMQAANPQRHAEAVSHLQRAEQIHKLHEQARGQQAQVMAAAIQHWSQQQDQAFEQSVAHEPPETMRAVKENLVRVARDAYGLDPNELRQAFSEHPILRAAPFQKLIYSAVKAHLAQEQVAQKKIPASIPNVQRPGVAGDRPSVDDAETSRAYKAFLRSPDPKSAAAFIAAKRGARR